MPDADDSHRAGASSRHAGPTDLDARSWRFVARSTVRKFADDGAGDIAAALTFHAVLALIPSMLVAVSIIALLGRESTPVSFVLEVVRAVAPEDAAERLGEIVDDLTGSAIGGLPLLLGLGLTVWAIARYIAVLGRGMNRAYEVEEGRAPWSIKVAQLLSAVVVIVASAAAILVLAASGSVAKAAGEVLGLGEAGVVVWRILRWPVLLAIVIATIAFLSDRAPNVRHPRFRWLSWGATLTVLVLVVASVLYGLYATTIVDYERVYGIFAGVIVSLLWLWIANLALVLGVEFDAALERARELHAGVPADKSPRLPPRDRSRIARKQARRTAEIIEARRLRGR